MKRTRWLGVLVMSLFVALLVSAACERAQAGFASIWAVDDGEKIFRDNLTSPLKTGANNSVWNGSSVSLSGARNEIVAFQLILEADGSGVSNVDVNVSNLTNGGNTIRGSHPLLAPNNYLGMGVELFTEHYFNVSVLSGDPSTGYFNWTSSAAPVKSGMTTGWMPDALVPFSAASGKGGAPFTIAANQNQGVWVDIYIDKGLPAGVYTGTITVKVNGSPYQTIPLSLQVLGLTLPDENHYKTMIYYSDYCIGPRHNLSGSALWPMLLEYNKLAHRHRLELIGAGTWDEISNLGGTISGTAFTSASNYEGPGEGIGNSLFSICTYGVTWTDNETAYRTESDAWENWFTANAPSVTRFLYLIDEPGSDMYSWIQTRASWIHNNPGPGQNLPVFVTKAVTDGLIGAVDIWGSPTAGYSQVTTATARSRGEEVWPYAAFRPKTAADIIDDWGIAYRIKPWIAKKSDITRWFTWESTHYIRNPNEINPNQPFDVWTDPLSFNTGNASETGNGDGTMMYPGQDYVFTAQDRQYAGPIASYRMKMYRRGAQDYEYMWLAEQAGKGAQLQNILQDLLPHVVDSAVTVPDWSNDDYPYDQARQELADLVLGVTRAPSAKFGANKTRGASPLTVNFTDLSIFAPTSWSWSFGDGGTSTAQNPSHTYSSVGSYTVSLTVGNAQGQDTETKPGYVTAIQEVIVYPDAWTSQGGRMGTSIIGGSLSDVQTDNGVYMVTQPANPLRKYSSMFTANSGYTPDQVARITVDYQAKTSLASQPGSTLLFARRPDQGYNLISDGNWSPGVTDTDFLWETTDVSTYLGTDGIIGFEMCGCPSSKDQFQISVDLMRWRLELASAQPPTADFSGNPTSGTAPLVVNFSDLSTSNPTSWYWTFGDGGTSTAQHPSHTYSQGQYTVSLTATNAQGSDGETKTNYITVNPGQPPVADFSGNPTSGSEPLAVAFTDLSTNSPTSWSWNFGDGGTSTAQHPSHTYSQGQYTVSLTATNAYGSDGETKTSYITVSAGQPPVADFSGNPTSGTAPLAVSFTDLSTGSPTSWSWTFGDGGTSTAQHPSHSYAAGTYTVALTATNPYGSDGETKTNYITASTGGGDFTASSAVVSAGTVVSGSLSSTYASDDSYWVIQSVKLTGKQSTQVDYTFETGLSSCSSLTVTSEWHPTVAPQEQYTYLWSYTSSSWQALSYNTVTSTSDQTIVVPVSSPSPYCSATGQVRVRLRTGNLGGTAWNHYLDLVKITIAP